LSWKVNERKPLVRGATPAQRRGLQDLELKLALQPWAQTAEFLAGDYTRPLLSSTWVVSDAKAQAEHPLTPLTMT
jgi:hypothetical protein